MFNIKKIAMEILAAETDGKVIQLDGFNELPVVINRLLQLAKLKKSYLFEEYNRVTNKDKTTYTLIFKNSVSLEMMQRELKKLVINPSKIEFQFYKKNMKNGLQFIVPERNENPKLHPEKNEFTSK